MLIQGFDAKNPTITFGISLSRYDCSVSGSPLMIVVNWDTRQVKLNSPLFSQQTLSLNEYDEIDGMNFKQWISHKIELVLSGSSK